MVDVETREGMVMPEERLNGLGDFFVKAKIREQTGATFYQYLLCPEYFDAKVMEYQGGKPCLN